MVWVLLDLDWLIVCPGLVLACISPSASYNINIKLTITYLSFYQPDLARSVADATVASDTLTDKSEGKERGRGRGRTRSPSKKGGGSKRSVSGGKKRSVSRDNK